MLQEQILLVSTWAMAWTPALLPDQAMIPPENVFRLSIPLSAKAMKIENDKPLIQSPSQSPSPS